MFIKILANKKQELLLKALNEKGLILLRQFDGGLNNILKSKRASFLMDIELIVDLFTRSIINHKINDILLKKIIDAHKEHLSEITVEYLHKYYFKGKDAKQFFIKTYDKYHQKAS